ncbi:MAG: NAD(P)H-hydrate dehydratase [Buchananella hordeovulneris]|nr:NAD(P)H-hydrate dehydratase [Buchananella hordeovulneris]
MSTAGQGRGPGEYAGLARAREAHTAQAVRVAEAALVASSPTDHWMRAAAFAVAMAVVRQVRARRGRLGGGRVLVLAGAGDNGGDGLYAAAYLKRRGMDVRALALPSVQPSAPRAQERWRAHPHALQSALQAGVSLHGGVEAELARWAASADAVIDALLGTRVAAGAGPRPPGPPPPGGVGPRPPGGPPGGGGRGTPPGIDPDTGEVHGPVLPAAQTVTMGAAKPGLLLPPAARLCGRVSVALPELLAPAEGGQPTAVRIEDADVTAAWPVPDPADHKYSRGVLGLRAGSARYPGAAVLAATAAVNAGVGMLRVLGQDAATQVLAACPEAVPGEGRVQAWVVGPGLSPDDLPQIAQQISGCLPEGLPLVVDATALAALPLLLASPAGGTADSGPATPTTSPADTPGAPSAGTPASQAADSQASPPATTPNAAPTERAAGSTAPLQCAAPATLATATTAATPAPLGPLTVLTPHAGELCALLRAVDPAAAQLERDDVTARPAHWARRAAQGTGAVVLLKGAVTVVAAPTGPLYTAAGAPAWLATAGAGDVLAGLLGALLAGRAANLTALVAAHPQRAQEHLAYLAAVAAHVHARAAARANPGGPLRAAQVADALAPALAELLTGQRVGE